MFQAASKLGFGCTRGSKGEGASLDVERER